MPAGHEWGNFAICSIRRGLRILNHMNEINPLLNDDVAAIERLLRNWGLWRDTCRWDRLRQTYAPYAQMKTTWFSGTAVDFIEASVRAATRPATVLHVMGPSTIEVCGERAIAETRVMLLLRDRLEGEEVDVTCYGRFVDRLTKQSARWLILSRAPIYEKDCLVPVRPGAALVIDEAVLADLPQGYRHLAYLQTLAGAQIQRDIPGHNSEEQQQMYADAQAWLSGEPNTR